MRSLEGKVAVITGSGQGVGRGIALFMAGEGAAIVTNNRKPLEESAKAGDKAAVTGKQASERRGDAGTVADEIRAMGGRAVPFYGDIADYGTAGRLIQTAIDSFGHIDILVNNAAGLGHGTIMDMTPEDWDYQTKAKMSGTFNTMSHAVPYMIRQGGGRILNCASDAWVGQPNLCAYSAGNAGVVGLTWAAALELAGKGITVNAFCPQAASPGHVTEFAKMAETLGINLGSSAVMSNSKLVAVEKDHADAIGIGPMLAYLCTDEAAEITGKVFSITASGRIAVYDKPTQIHEISRGQQWTVEELQDETKRLMMPKLTFPLGNRICDMSGVGGVTGERRSDAKGFVNILVPRDAPCGLSVGSVLMEPGQMTDWHEHDGYQIIIAISGEGVCETEDGTSKSIAAGEVLVCNPHERHRHGAAEDSWFECVGIVKI